MQIVLVRHGEPEWVRDGLNVDDPPLTERGRRQAELVAQVLAKEHFDEILVSPVSRARQTAEPVFRAFGRPEEIDHWLEEIRNPIWHGTPKEKADLAYRQERARPSHEQWAGLEGGEPVRDFVARIRQGCGLFLAERGVEPTGGELPVWHMTHPERRICLIAHAGTNSVVTCHLLGLSSVPWEWDRFVIQHASVTRLESFALGDGHTFALTKLSDVEHLAVDDRTN